jgi:CRISPR-associated protein Csm4
MLFGHFCWQTVYDPALLKGSLGEWVDAYPEKPFLIFSSAYPKLVIGPDTFYALKRPDLPLSFLFPRGGEGDKCMYLEERKAKKAKKWMLIKEDLLISFPNIRFLNDQELLEEMKRQITDETQRRMKKLGERVWIMNFTQPHNTIDRLTGTTGTGAFAPYTQASWHYYPETELAIFVLVDETATDIFSICTALERIGKWGYGKDASTGWGRFSLGETEELTFPKTETSDACYTLGPTVPEKNLYQEIFSVPFTRFGKHGDILAQSANPFKNPVIMADEGAILIPRDRAMFSRPFLGMALSGISAIRPETIMQGYSIYLPIKLELKK